jgi:Raf kinase inhibitor-like YbhB/YbcL family protein
MSPPLEWSDIKNGVKELALICEDPDASGDEPFVHWIMYGIDPQTTSLPEGIKTFGEISKPTHARQGVNSTGRIGFSGPLPPPKDDWHHYHFKLFALDEKLDLSAGVGRDGFYEAIEGHVVDTGETIGRYKRKKG